jgi:superkiller protein 3
VSRGRAYLNQGRPDLAFQAVADVRDEAPGAGEAMTIAGLALIRFRELQGARLALERALKLQPNQFDAALTLAELDFALGNGRRGIEVLQIAARLRPEEFQVWFTMGKVLHDLGDLPRAIQAYEKALNLQPRHREALVGLIGTLIAADQPDDAERWVALALQLFPDDAAVLGLAARRAFDANRLDEAIDLATRALARDSRELHALLARARSLVVKGQWQQALPDAESAVALAPNHLGALQLLQKIETRLGLRQRAAETQARREQAQHRIELMNQLNQKIAEHPADPQYPWSLGETAQKAGSYLLASRCYEAALALDPKYQPARASLAALRAEHPELVQQSGPPGSVLTGRGMSLSSFPAGSLIQSWSDEATR